MTFATGMITLLIASAVAVSPPPKRTPVLDQTLPPANPPVRLIKGTHIIFAPGQSGGRHLHPVSVVGVVTEGSFRYQQAGGAEQILHQGDAFSNLQGRRSCTLTMSRRTVRRRSQPFT